MADANMNITQHFMGRDTPQNSILTLGGTGPNGSTQVIHLLNLGSEYLDSLRQINVLSASAFSYFIYKALHCNALNIENYLHYDRHMRNLHSASFFRAARHFMRRDWRSTALYPNSLIKDTIFILFDKEFAEKKLVNIDGNVSFWAYCSNHDMDICVNRTTFPEMRVWEVICACVSIEFIHGEFVYGKYSFRDAVFSPHFAQLKRDFIKDNQNHLYLNYKKTQISKNVIFLQNKASRLPMVELLTDYIMMTANIPNWRVNRIHREVVNLIHKPTSN